MDTDVLFHSCITCRPMFVITRVAVQLVNYTIIKISQQESVFLFLTKETSCGENANFSDAVRLELASLAVPSGMCLDQDRQRSYISCQSVCLAWDWTVKHQVKSQNDSLFPRLRAACQYYISKRAFCGFL